MADLVRPELLALAAVAHGSVALEELRQNAVDPADVLDFSVNTNPLGPAPWVMAAVRETDWDALPGGDDEAPLRAALAKRWACNPTTRWRSATGRPSCCG